MSQERDTIEPNHEKGSPWRWLVVVLGYSEILAGIAFIGGAFIARSHMYTINILVNAVLALLFLILPGRFLLRGRGWQMWLSQIPPIAVALAILMFGYAASQ